MKILWLVNITLPRIALFLGKPVSPMGGWLTGLSEELLKQEGLNLTVCFPVRGKAIAGVCVGKLSFYGFPKKNQQTQFEKILKEE